MTLQTYPEATCGREGRYNRKTLAARFGREKAIPDVLGALVADCPRQADGGQTRCYRPYLVDPATGEKWRV